MSDILQIPKTELHQHTDGSIPVETTWNLMRLHNLQPVDTVEEMEKLLVVQPDDEGKGLLEYLKKFHYPLWVTQFYENLTKVTYDIVADAYVNHNVRLLELRYSPTIHKYAGLNDRQAISSVLKGLNKAKSAFKDLETGLIVIAMRHMGGHIAKILARVAAGEAQSLHERCGVIGFDIAGAERGNPPRLFKDAYDIARKAGLGLTAHAGEDENAEAIWEAIDVLGCTRIGHGCAAITDKALLRRLARDQILVEVCQTSNYQTGAVKREQEHPLYTFLEYGIPVAICTDNTTVSNTNQTKENTMLNLSIEEIENIHYRATAHSFIKKRQPWPPRKTP
ncbi:MAG: adenosine deaminase family protein [Candidatus Thorarchaeota archaeon]|jgi:adenosine deaminase